MKSLQSILSSLKRKAVKAHPPAKPKMSRRQAFDRVAELDARDDTDRAALVDAEKQAMARIRTAEAALQDAQIEHRQSAQALRHFDGAIYHERACCLGIVESQAPKCIAESLEFVSAIRDRSHLLRIPGSIEIPRFYDPMPASEAPAPINDKGENRDISGWAEEAAHSLERNSFMAGTVKLSGCTLNHEEMATLAAELSSASAALIALRRVDQPEADIEARCAEIIQPLEKYSHIL